jgi:hypothetical protein
LPKLFLWCFLILSVSVSSAHLSLLCLRFRNVRFSRLPSELFSLWSSTLEGFLLFLSTHLKLAYPGLRLLAVEFNEDDVLAWGLGVLSISSHLSVLWPLQGLFASSGLPQRVNRDILNP